MTDSPPGKVKEADPAPAPRLMSLDALRGFDMFCIVGLDALVEGLRKASPDAGPIQAIAHQLEHVEWAGFHFEDLIFPMFVFIVGVSLVFSTTRTIEREGRARASAKIVRRALLLYTLGIFYYGGFGTPFERIRLLGVLQRIAISYLFAALIFVYCGNLGRLIWCVGLLVGYWLLMTFLPVPGGQAGDFAEGHNLANWVDKRYLPLRKWDGDHDPEGLLSTLPAIANCLIGVFAGMLLLDRNRSDYRKVLTLAMIGLTMVALGWLWNVQFPVIKKLWTSSFVLVACGYASLLLAGFYLIIDTWGWRQWAQPFVWIGMNPITIYMLDNILEVDKLARRFVGGDLNKMLGVYGPLAVAVVGVLIMFAIARFLYARRIFLRV
jgi:predicted acyltransferase